MDHLYIAATVLFTVYSQLIMRWQVGKAGPLPVEIAGKISFIMGLLLNPWVLSGIVATFLAGVSWMLAMTKFELSYAFPFVSLNYALVMLAGAALFGESLSAAKVLGLAAITLGIVVIARS